MGVFRHGIAHALKIKKKKPKPVTLFLRHPFRCLEADVLFVFNNIFFKGWVSSEAFHYP